MKESELKGLSIIIIVRSNLEKGTVIINLREEKKMEVKEVILTVDDVVIDDSYLY